MSVQPCKRIWCSQLKDSNSSLWINVKPSPGCFVIRKMQGIEQRIVFYHMCVCVCVCVCAFVCILKREFKRMDTCICMSESLHCSSETITLFVNWLSVQFSCSVMSDPWIAARQASLSITNSRSSLRLTSIESVMPSSHLILCHPLLLLPPVPPSIRVFSNESTLRMRWPKYWSFSFSIIPSKEHRGLISFRIDWLDLLAVQGTLKSLLQHHSSKASILRCQYQYAI